MPNSTANQMKTELIFIRHGATPGNLEKRYIGRTDESLSEEGKTILSENLAKNKYPSAQKVFVSPLKRCQETSSLIYPTIPFQVVENLKETDFGDFEGKNYKELSENKAYQQWIDSNGTLPFPNGESMEEAEERSLRAFELILEDLCAHPLQQVAVVAHGGTLMSILSHYLGGNYYDYQVDNGEGFACSLEICEDKVWFSQVRRL